MCFIQTYNICVPFEDNNWAMKAQKLQFFVESGDESVVWTVNSCSLRGDSQRFERTHVTTYKHIQHQIPEDNSQHVTALKTSNFTLQQTAGSHQTM